MHFLLPHLGFGPILPYNTLGQQVRTVYRGTPTAGESQTARIETDNLASGAYFLRLQSDGKMKTQRVTVVL